MANQNGRPIAPARKLVAAVVGTIAVFVMLFGLGMSSWAIVALGVAMLALAIGIGMVNVVRRGARAWVAGSAQVKAVSDAPATSIYGRAELQIVIVAPGLPTSEVTVRDPRVPVSKWPRVGDTLPVTVDVDDMRRVRINWDEADTREGAMTAPPAYYDEDLPDDDLLGGEPEPPPWATRDRQWGRGPDEPPPPPPAPRSGDLDDGPPPPVIVRDDPGGPILEGQLVDPDYDYTPLPQRARTATATAPSRPADSRPRPRPRPHATATMDPSAPEPAAPAQRTASAPSSAPSSEPSDITAAAAAGPSATDSPVTDSPVTDSPVTDSSSETDLSAATGQDRQIDLPLDGDPEPAPETTSAARQAMASGIMAPPVSDPRDAPPSGDRAGRVRSADDDLLGDLEPPPWTVREQQRSAASAPVVPHDPAPHDSTPDVPAPDVPAPERPAERQAQPGDAARTVGLGAAVAAAIGNVFRGKKQTPEDRATGAKDRAAGTESRTAGTEGRAASAESRAAGTDSRAADTEGRAASAESRAAGTEGRAAGTEGRAAGTEGRAAGAPVPRPADRRAAPEWHQRPETDRPDSDAAAIDIPLGSADTRPDPAGAGGSHAAAPTPSPGPIAGIFGAPLTGRAARPTVAEPNDAAAGPAADADPGSAAAGAGPATPGRGSVAAPSAGSVTTWPSGGAGTARAPEAAAQPESAPTSAGTVYGAAGGAGPATDAAAKAGSPGPTAGRAAAGAAGGAAAGAGGAAAGGTARRGPWADLEGGFEPDERTDDLITAYPSARPSPASAIHGVGITVLVTNLERSVAFYREMLGFYEIDAGTGSAVLASGDTRLVLRKVHDLSSVAGRLIYLNLEVGDVEAVYEELKRKGAVFVHGPRPVNRGDKLELWAASFHDPDEHNIAITQWRAIR